LSISWGKHHSLSLSFYSKWCTAIRLKT